MSGWTVVPNQDASAWKPVVEPPAPQQDWRAALTQTHPLNTPQTGNRLLDPAINALANVGAGGLGVILHPVDTAIGLGKTALHVGQATIGQPQNFANDMSGVVQGVMQHPGEVIPAAIGQTAVMGGLGEAGAGAVRAVAPAVQSTAAELAPRMYGSALKPSTTLTAAERANVIGTGLQNEIPVSKAGVEQLSDRIDALNQAIKGEIAADPNRPIDPNAVAARIDPTLQKFSNQVVAQPDLDAIRATRQQFLAEQGAQPAKPAIPPSPTGLLGPNGQPLMSGGTPARPAVPAPPMGAADAQAMKQGTYQVLRGKYGEQGSATVEAQKALARGLKEEIASQFPEINSLNAQESKLLDLQPILERAVNRISNSNMIGIGTPIAGGAAKAVTGSTPIGVVTSVLKSVIDDPMIKSRLAIALSKSAKIPIAQALSRVQSYSGALQATSAASQQSQDGQAQNGQP